MQTPIAIRFPQLLREGLKPLGEPRQCALLNYPNHVNIGDHLIWAGAVDYLQKVTKTRIAYAADLDTLSARELNGALEPADPILLTGGGSLGDLWPERQEFHERVVLAHPGRAIFLLPQSVHFSDPRRARRAADIFNAHAGMTIFTRDHYSYAAAGELFTGCRIHMAPDMAFQMAGWFGLPAPPGKTVLLLARKDKEAAAAEWASGSGYVRQDWVSFERRWRWGRRAVPGSRAVARWAREGWLRRILHPNEYWARNAWLDGLRANPETATLAEGPGCASSLGLIWEAWRQFRPHSAVVTDRLHGHLLATLLGIPNVVRPNSYGKIKGFYAAWMGGVPWCRFVEEDAALAHALAEVVAARPTGTDPF